MPGNKVKVHGPWNGQPGCNQPIEWRQVQQADGSLKSVMFNAGTNIMHLPICPARQGQFQAQPPVQQQGTFQPQQQVVNPFAPAPPAAQQPEQGPESDNSDIIAEGLATLNTTLTNGLLAIFKELRPDNQDSMLATIAQNLGTLINLQKPAAMLKDEAEAPPAEDKPAENPFEAPKKETKKK